MCSVQYRVVVAMFVRFREELKRIGDAIVQRNKERESDVKYPYLHPINIANNINI